MTSHNTRFATLGLLALGACASPQMAPPMDMPNPMPMPVDTTGGISATPRVAPPAPLAERPMQFPSYTETTLPNGLRLLVVENHARPVASVDLYVETGAAGDPAAKLGLAGMTADLLTKGTPTRTAKQISERIEGVGGSINASAGNDQTVISTNVLSDQVGLAFDLLSDVALRPAFAADEIQTVRTQTLSGLQAQLGQPAAVAGRTFASRVYGSHPYGSAPTPATVKAITRGDIQQFHRTYFKPGNAMLVVSGDVTLAQARDMATRYFGRWSGGDAPNVTFPALPAANASRIYLVNRPGSVQSNVIVGNSAIRPNNPDYFALVVMNQILGGGVDARLFETLRQKKGWTYGSYSSINRPKDVGTFRATAEVRTEVTDSALAELLNQIREMRQTPVSDAELAAAKGFLNGSYPLRFETAGEVADRIATTRLLGLPVDYLTQYRERIAAVSAADIQRVAQKYLTPDQMTIVVVGDAPKIMPTLTGMAPITLLDVEGKQIDPASLEVRASTERYDASKLTPMTFTYGIIVQGNSVGAASYVLAREGQNWASTSSVGPMNSKVVFTDALVPVSMKQTLSQGPVNIDLDLKYAGGKVTGAAKLPAQMGGDKTIDTEVVQGTIFSGMDAWVLAVADLADGKSVAMPVFDAKSGSVVNAVAKVVGSESVTVPAGTFPAWKLELSGSDSPGTLWVRRDAPHITLKQAIAGQPVEIVLQSMK